MPVMRTELLAAYLPQLRAQISSKLYMIKDIIMREKSLLHNRGFREISPLSKKPLSIERNGLEATQPTKPQ
jgi:hypothetical protein